MDTDARNVIFIVYLLVWLRVYDSRVSESQTLSVVRDAYQTEELYIITYFSKP